MTCIVGLLDSGKVWIGGDSAGVSGLDLTVRADQKVFKNGDFLMGFTSSFRMGQLLRYALQPPTPREGESKADDKHYRFMVVDFIDTVRACLKTGGFAGKEHEVERGGTFLVGHRGRLYVIYSDYQVGASIDGYVSVGCGESYALGSLHATATQGLAPEARVRTAMEAAAKFSGGVHPPFVIESI